MISLNQTIKLPLSAKLYVLTRLFLVLLGVTFVFSLGGNGEKVFGFLFPFFIFAGLWSFLYLSCISYIVTDNTITINSGVLIKTSKSIPFDRVQDVNTKRGIISMMFGVGEINIWTASPRQVQISNGKSNNKPTGSLVLKKEDTIWLQTYILNTNSIAK